MINRIDACFNNLDKPAFIAFITAGDPKPEITVPTMHSLVKGGVDIIELGVPFSDPNADGVSIQGSNQRALLHNVGILDVLAMVVEFRKIDTKTPVVLMGYLNPIENLGVEKFANKAKTSGVDGLITVDLPPEESINFDAIIKNENIHPIYLLAPTSTDERVQMISSLSRGFIYYVSVKGVTGAKAPDYKEVEQQVARIRQHTDLPVVVGFGIGNNAGVSLVGKFADGVVVGSAIVNFMATVNDTAGIPLAVEDFIGKLIN